MMRTLVVLLALLSPLQAQETVPAATAEGAVLRGLDRMNGRTWDYELQSGETTALGPLSVRLIECRYPTDNPAGDAYAHLEIVSGVETVFSGWMLASSPALNAMDHPRYDVWVLRCRTSRPAGMLPGRLKSALRLTASFNLA